jgi:hypothetical protein
MRRSLLKGYRKCPGPAKHSRAHFRLKRDVRHIITTVVQRITRPVDELDVVISATQVLGRGSEQLASDDI